MSMLKVIAPHAYEFDEPARMVKVSSRGVVGVDLRELEKRVGPEIARRIVKVAEELQPGETLLHLLALGTTESVGPNRNGDGFTEETCRKYHDTFRKYARWYRNHKNRDPAKSYGVVRDSFFNDKMQRIELLVALNRTKSAAARNGGLVADLEHEALERGEPLPVSMACTVPYDVCSWCGNKAPSRLKYCEDVDFGGHCKAGGLKRNMGKTRTVIENGERIVHHLHADNPTPRFFDISYVPRPADPTAYVFGVIKAASSPVGGAELAEVLGVTVPEWLETPLSGDQEQRQLAWLAKLASVEYGLECSQTVKQARALYADAVRPEVQLGEASPVDVPRQVLGALNRSRCLLSPEGFLQIVCGLDRDKAIKVGQALRPQLSGIFRKLHHEGDIPGSRYQGIDPPSNLQKWAERMRDVWGTDPPRLQKRALLANCVDRHPRYEVNYGQREVEKLAREYALYKVAALSQFGPPEDYPLTAIVAVIQNHT